MASRYYQGTYKPVNPGKIIGDPTKIIYRSSWEHKVFAKLDRSPNVVKWGSETIVVPYVSPKDNRIHRYFPDLIVIAKGADGSYITTMIEIKPYGQSIPPKAQGKNKERFLNECMTYAVNQAKWKAAEDFCEKRNIKFTVMTEKDIFVK